MGDGNLLLTNRPTQKRLTELGARRRQFIDFGAARVKPSELWKFERDSTLGVSYDALLALLVLPYHRFQYFRNRPRSDAKDPAR